MSMIEKKRGHVHVSVDFVEQLSAIEKQGGKLRVKIKGGCLLQTADKLAHTECLFLL